MPGKLFQSGLMFVGKTGAYPSKAPFRCSTLGQASDYTHKHKTRLEKFTKDKH